jgi:hypothetical protein
MDIDATTTTYTKTFGKKTPEDYRKSMVGRCYGCGSKDHRKAEGHHERDICNYCGLTGHLATVCRKKYFGQNPQKAKIASTSNETTDDPSFGLSEIGAILKQLSADQKTTAAQLDELKKGF